MWLRAVVDSEVDSNVLIASPHVQYGQIKLSVSKDWVNMYKDKSSKPNTEDDLANSSIIRLSRISSQKLNPGSIYLKINNM